MLVEAWDTAFVRATRADVHRVLTQVPAWPHWWPNLRDDPGGLRDDPGGLRDDPGGLRDDPGGLRDDPGGLPSCAALVVPPPGRRGRHRVRWQVVKVREPDKGIRLHVHGDLVGDAEWFYLDERAGVTVHHILKATSAARGWRSVLAAHRAAVRHAMERLKDGLEGDRLPGAEPDPSLLAAQDAALTAYARELAASRAESATE